MKPTQERLLYEELAQELVTPERFGRQAVQATVIHLPLPEISRIYGLQDAKKGLDAHDEPPRQAA